jgi:hypothetical protein
MSAKGPGKRPALGRCRSLSRRNARDADAGQRDNERDAALWLYAWSHDALHPTGDLLAARLTSPAVIRPGPRVTRISPHSRRRPLNAST